MSLTLTELELMNFRNCRCQHLKFDSPQIVLEGANGSGKSNLLEAIYYLSILRSFRNAGIRDMVMIGERSFILRGLIHRKNYSESVEVEQTLNSCRRLFIDGSPIRKSSEFIREFRAVAFAPEDKFITSGSSCCRRKFFDMFISVMEPEYLNALQRYAAALSQRNAALRNQAKEATIAAFEPELASAAAIIGPARSKYAAKICEAVNALFGSERLGLTYEPEYPDEKFAYLEKLSQDRSRDRKRLHTTFGPQTDEFVFTLDGKNLRSFGSNGQLRLTALYLKMAEFTLVSAESGSGVVALVDDVTGELDWANRDCFFNLLARADQTFYTFTECPVDRRSSSQIIKLPL